MSAVYTASMVLLVFAAALVLTKTFVKWIERKKKKTKARFILPG
jgi:hypothetical protein